jgi:hypothetical protein
LVSYLLTDRFSVGLGGRYWAMWVPDGHLTAAQFNVNTERYGMFAQASYAFASGQ